MQPGAELNHYRIRALLGEGGMGRVYRAEDTRLKRQVAIKVLPLELAADPERLARLEREAQLLAQLEHPNVAAVYGLEESAGTRFLVMQLVEGETLGDRIAAGPIPVDSAIPLALQIAEGLEAAHERGIVHRDLKPANIMVTPEGGVRILDFGLAKATAGPGSAFASELTASPTMMAPTQAGVILDALAISGEPFLVAAGHSSPSLAADGSLLMVRGGISERFVMTWISRDGVVGGTIGPPAEMAPRRLAVSPNGHRVVLSLTSNAASDLWVLDDADVTLRLTAHPETESFPSWDPARDRIVYTRESGARGVRPAGGAGAGGWRTGTHFSWTQTVPADPEAP